MKPIHIFFDPDYPSELVESLQKIHDLQSIRDFEVEVWDNEKVSKIGNDSALFLLVDFQKRGLSERILRHVEDGMRIFVCRTLNKDLEYFEFAMTVLRVWPFIVEKGQKVKEPCCFTFLYGGRKLSPVKLKGNGSEPSDLGN